MRDCMEFPWKRRTAVLTHCANSKRRLPARHIGRREGAVLSARLINCDCSLACCATKAAVGAMTRYLAVAWARDNIRVLDVAPGYIETGMNRAALAGERLQVYIKRRMPMRRPGRADQ